jgi:hypothetical protein
LHVPPQVGVGHVQRQGDGGRQDHRGHDAAVEPLGDIARHHDIVEPDNRDPLGCFPLHVLFPRAQSLQSVEV